MFEIDVDNFNYLLPEEYIAKYPLKKRDDSKLLIHKNNIIFEKKFKDIVDIIPKKSLLIYNNSKVIKARLNFKNYRCKY